MAITSVIGKQTININSDANYFFQVAPQGDSQARFVDVEFTTDNGIYNLPSGTTAILEGKNAGGYNIFISCIMGTSIGLGANVVRVPLSNGVLSYAGVGKYLLALYNGGTYIQSFPFNIVVTEAPYDIVALQGDDVYEALNKAIAKAMASNKWVTGDGNPNTIGATGSKGDLYLNTADGTLWVMTYSGVQLVWAELMDTSVTPPKQMTIMERVYIRYADDDSSSTPMYTQPVDTSTTPPTVRDYVGFFVSTDPPSAASISVKSNYAWSPLRFDLTSVTTKYAKSNSYTSHPTSGWQNSVPLVTSDEYLWTQISLNLKGGYSYSYYTVTQYGKPGGFGTPTCSIVESAGEPTLTITTDATSPNDAKIFDFDFEVRGGHWKMGNIISGSGSQTVTALNASNTVIGDMYINTDSTSASFKKSYRCTAVTATNSSWDESITFNTVSSIDDLANTVRGYGTLSSGNSINITINDPMFVNDASSTLVDYHVKYLTSVPGFNPSPDSYLEVNNGNAVAHLLFKMNATNPVVICVEIIKKTR